MALYYELPVYKDASQLILEVYAVTKEFPCKYKYSLGQNMKRDAMELIERKLRKDEIHE